MSFASKSIKAFYNIFDNDVEMQQANSKDNFTIKVSMFIRKFEHTFDQVCAVLNFLEHESDTLKNNLRNWFFSVLTDQSIYDYDDLKKLIKHELASYSEWYPICRTILGEYAMLVKSFNFGAIKFFVLLPNKDKLISDEEFELIRSPQSDDFKQRNTVITIIKPALAADTSRGKKIISKGIALVN